MRNVDIQGVGLSLTDTLRQYTLRRLAAAFARIDRRIGRITVRVGDLNGPRGGEDKFCRVLVRIAGQDDVYIEEKRSDLYAAIGQAAERAAGTARRRLGLLKRHRPGWPAQVLEPAT